LTDQAAETHRCDVQETLSRYFQALSAGDAPKAGRRALILRHARSSVTSDKGPRINQVDGIRNLRPFTWTKTADEILNSLADYLAKLRTGHSACGQE
jgi:hypothetical protein